jgi:hypothetical protein
MGIRWWGFYLNGTDGDEDPLNTWTVDQVNILRQANIQPIGIWVPDPDLQSDPVEAASEAYRSATSAGCSPKIGVLYNGNHVPASGPVWLPIPGSPPTDVGHWSAIQYGAGTIGSTSVDLSLASADWNMDSLVVDFEYNTINDPTWYPAFQTQIAKLSSQESMMSDPLPESAYPLKSVDVVTDTVNLLDVFILGSDHLYHKWFVTGQGWLGPDIIDGSV